MVPPWVLGPRWRTEGLRQPGWLLLPLRGFLGVTFTFAGLQKLANPAYLDPHSPTSVVAQMAALSHTSPIGPLLGLSLHAPTEVGLLIAFGELAVGLGVLLGLWARLAALGGMVLSLTFFLTVSWATTPYYYGSDIVFTFAWTVVAGFGAAGVLSLDAWRRERARASAGLGPVPAAVEIAAPRLRELCGRGSGCALRDSGTCALHSGCPVVLPDAAVLSKGLAADIDRRTVLIGARTAGLVGVVAALSGGVAAAAGRLAGGSHASPPATLPGPLDTAGPRAHRATHPSSAPSSPSAPPSGTAIGAASAVPVGQGAHFTDPAGGEPAWVVHLTRTGFVAFSAVCTHAGCTVGFDPAALQFVCPCHGGTYSARTGQVISGPPPAPLPAIAVHVVEGQIRVR